MTTKKKLTKISSSIQRSLSDLLEQHRIILSIVHEIHRNGGRVLLVGGAVRDLLLGLPTKDFDFEIYDISFKELESVLRKFGEVSLVGKSFGVLRVHGLDVDWSMPRRDSAGRKPRVIIDERMTLKEAFARRDLTINAMGIDLITFELIDPFNGEQDLKSKILRTPDQTLFIEDPLRFYRVMQFIGRFDMEPDAQLSQLCSTMNLSGISIERIEGEFEKLLLLSHAPSRGIRWINAIGRLSEILPEVAATIDIPQEHEWHPEGDVFEHTMQTIDAAARLHYDNAEHKLIILYAALCHDLGKVTTTRTIEGRIRSLGHEQEGVEPTKQLLKRITTKKTVIDTVIRLVKYHMAPGQFIANAAGSAAYKRLAKKLAPNANLFMLAQLALADKRGRNPASHEPLTISIPFVEEFEKKAAKVHVLFKPEDSILQGKDIIDVISPGPLMGKLLKQAYVIQIEDDIHDKAELKKRVLTLYEKEK